jgi:hypothetical protein
MRQPQAVLVGLLAAGVTTGLVEGLGHLLAPPPFPVDMASPDAMEHLLSDASVAALAFVPLAWLLGTGVGAWLAVRLSNNHPARPGWITAGVFGCLTLVQLGSFPHPPWMWLAALLAIVGGAWLGIRKAPRPVPGE